MIWLKVLRPVKCFFFFFAWAIMGLSFFLWCEQVLVIRHQTGCVTKWVLVVSFLTRPQIRELKCTHVCIVIVCACPYRGWGIPLSWYWSSWNGPELMAKRPMDLPALPRRGMAACRDVLAVPTVVVGNVFLLLLSCDPAWGESQTISSSSALPHKYDIYLVKPTPSTLRSA